MSLLTSLFRLIPPSMKPGWCPKTLQQAFNEALSGTQVTFLIQSGNFIYNYGSSTPTADNRIFPWLNTTTNRWYTFQFGLWVARNARDPDGEWIFWPKTESELWTYEEGDGTDPRPTLPGGGANPAYVAPTPITGSMWMTVDDMTGRMPVGAGIVPGSSAPLTLAVGDKGGEGEHSLTADEMPPHTHPFKVIAYNSAASGSGALTGGVNNNPNDGEFNGITDNAGGVSNGATPPVYTVNPHNNMSPYRAGLWAVRTARIYYTLPA